MKTVAVVMAMTLALFGCAGSPDRDRHLQEAFATDIKDNGLKLFVYSITLHRLEDDSRPNAAQLRNKERAGGRTGGREEPFGDEPSRASVQKRMKAFTYEKLELKLQETGYCKEGFIEIENYIDRVQSQVRGECREGATDEDRERFTNVENRDRAATALQSL